MRRANVLKLITIAFGAALLGSASSWASCPAVPNTIANGQPADATKVMANFGAIVDCLNNGQLTVPPVSSVVITGSGGGNATIQNPSATTSYNFNLPVGPGTAGQVLTSNGPSTAMTWSTISSVRPPIADGIPVARPAASTFDWLNQGPATYAEHANGPITITLPTQTSNEIRGLQQTIPGSPPYTLTVKLDVALWATSFYQSGVYVIDGAGKLNVFFLANTGSSQEVIAFEHWDSTTTFNSSQQNRAIANLRTLWFRLANDGTNWNASISLNGADWIPFYTEPVGAFIGSPVAMGVYGNNNNGTGNPSAISIWSYELASGTGTDSSW